MTWTGNTIPIGGFRLTYGSIIMLLLFAYFFYALRSTAWGKHVYATGDDVEAARLAGIRTSRVLFSVYTVAGLLYAVGGWILIGRLASASPNVGTDYNLDSITAVVLGGTSLFGGRGSVIGTLIGALIVGVFRNGLQLAGVEVVWQGFAIGLLVLVAVSLDQWIRKVKTMTEPSATGRRPVLQAKGLTKRYGRVVAIDGSDLELYPGEILAVIGDNGAGKSSLIKALSGALIPDSGEIFLDGQPVHFRTPMDARAAGIETVYQTLAVAPGLDIADNLFLGREERRPGPLGSVFRMLDRKHMRSEAKRHMSELGVATLQNIGQAVESLSGGQRQAVAVARSAAFGSKVVILDEPTAALGVKEGNRVLQLIRDVRDRGPAGDPDQPQHAARLRGRRPHPHPAPRPPGHGHHPEVPLHVRGGRHHDRRRRTPTAHRLTAADRSGTRGTAPDPGAVHHFFFLPFLPPAPSVIAATRASSRSCAVLRSGSRTFQKTATATSSQAHDGIPESGPNSCDVTS